MIKHFKDTETEKLFHAIPSWKFPPAIQQRAHYKLRTINAARSLSELFVPPSNRLKKLQGHINVYSIRINQQWRICFQWHEGDAYHVEITDYH